MYCKQFHDKTVIIFSETTNHTRYMSRVTRDGREFASSNSKKKYKIKF